MKLRLFAMSAAVAITLISTPARAVINGQPDGQGHPYVGVIVDPFSGSFCSGALVSPTLLVTAGHCFSTPGQLVVVVLHESALEGFGQGDLLFGLWYPHPDYCEQCGKGKVNDFQNDVAVVQLFTPVPTSVVSTYATLPTVNLTQTLPYRQTVDVVGYGVNDWVPAPGGKQPQYNFNRTAGKLEIVPGGGVQSSEFLPVTSNPSDDKAAMCYGDSGGPLLLGNTIVAHSSHGQLFCKAVGYAYRIDTQAALSFIQSFLAQ